MPVSRRNALISGGAAVLGWALPSQGKPSSRTILNDASSLNPTPVARHWIVPSSEEAAWIKQLRSELKEAAAVKRPVAVGAARHSMGGQSLPRNGTAISLDAGRCTPDPAKRLYRATAGARWSNVIAALDPIGFSPKVMQSNNDFGVASTFSVNAHGWPVPHGPFGETVHSIRLMLADGTIVRCSRSENAELFGLVMGGYGLFGIILDLDIEMVPNRVLMPSFATMRTEDFAERFIGLVRGQHDVQMAYGRLSMARDDFLEEALLVTFAPHSSDKLPPVSSSSVISSLSREIYRAQIGSDAGKRARWFAETEIGPAVASTAVTRNALLNEPVSNLANRDPTRTDILHEYFIPPEKLHEFVEACQALIPQSKQDLLNITLRYVAGDAISVLRYAPHQRIAAVMSFAQKRTPEAEADMIALTEGLIDRALALGGSFYLPYRLHAHPDQLAQAYPRLEYFIERKLHYDSKRLFRNLMWDTYFSSY